MGRRDTFMARLMGSTMGLALLLGSGLAQAPNQEEVRFSRGDVTFVGTLTVPEGEAPHPGVVLLTGSGEQDRDNAHPSVPGYRPFATLAQELAGRGIASLRYDERGVGASGGDFASATSIDFASDADAALAFLRGLEVVEASRVGLLGHSEGAWLAAMVAARDPGVAFVIALAGHAVPGAELLPVQAERSLRASGAPDAQVEAILADQREEIDLIVERDWEALERRVYEQSLAAFQELPEAQREELGDLEEAARAQVEASMVSLQGWLHTFLTSDPADAWAQVQVPVLALFGALDTQVDLAQNRPALEAALRRAGNDDVTVRVVEDANHLFQEASTAADDYASLTPELAPDVLDIIGGWLTRTLE